MKPTVLHFLPTFDTGGLGSLGLTMIRAWPEEARHIVVAPQYPGTKPALLGEYRTLVTQGNVAQVPRNMQALPTIYRDAMAAQLRKMQVGRNVSHVINYNFTDHVWNSQAFRLCGYPDKRIICHVGTVLPDEPKIRAMVNSPHAFRTTFVPASRAVFASIAGLLETPVNPQGVDANGHERISDVVWNGVDVNAFASAMDRTNAAPMVFGFTGRMANPPVKDWDLLLNAFRIYSGLVSIPGGAQPELRIAGDGPLRARLESEARGLNVKFVGNLAPSAIPAFLAEIDCFIMAALPFEGFSMALVEAIASGRLILGTNVPSVAELFLSEGGGAFLIDAGTYSAEALANQMVALGYRGDTSPWASARRERRRMNIALVQALQKRLSAKTMAQAYWELK